MILPGVRTIGTRSPEISYIKRTSWTFNIFAALLFISATAVLKYSSKTRVTQIEAGKTEIHSYPPEILQNLFEKTKARTPTASQITTIQEGVSGNFANLLALTTQSGIQGNISMVFEGGLWKLGIESWKGYTATN